MAELVAKRYANALFEVALESDDLDKKGEELSFIAQSLRDHEDFFKAMKSPLIKSQEKKDLMKEVFTNHISKELMNFVFVIIDKGRSSALLEIQKEYKALVAKHQNTIEGVATTAILMTEEELKALSQKLSDTSGKTVALTNQVDEKILGGVLIQLGDKIIDGTIKRKLVEIEEGLKKVIL